MRRLIALAVFLAVPAPTSAQPAAVPGRTSGATAERPRFELDARIGGSAVLNASSTGPRYSGLGVMPGAGAAIVFPKRWTLSFDVTWQPLGVYEFSSNGSSGSIDYVGSLFAMTGVGYDTRWNRFHVRPSLWTGFVRGRRTHSELPGPAGDIYREESTYGLLVTPGLEIAVDIADHFLVGAMARFPIAFRVGGGRGFESEGNVDVAGAYALFLGARF